MRLNNTLDVNLDIANQIIIGMIAFIFVLSFFAFTKSTFYGAFVCILLVSSSMGFIASLSLKLGTALLATIAVIWMLLFFDFKIIPCQTKSCFSQFKPLCNPKNYIYEHLMV